MSEVMSQEVTSYMDRKWVIWIHIDMSEFVSVRCKTKMLQCMRMTHYWFIAGGRDRNESLTIQLIDRKISCSKSEHYGPPKLRFANIHVT